MKTAVLIIDMLNLFDFPRADKLARAAEPVSKRIAALRVRAAREGWAVIFVNDNFGRWRSDWKTVYGACLAEDALGKDIALRLKPGPDDYFVLKPKNSAFLSTCLDVLLEDLKIERLVITGIAANICVLYSAHDAHMRGFELHVPRDCVASVERRDTEFALHLLKSSFGVAVSSRVP